ncbi:aspartic peptidase domain-containing protein [Suillus spraguei]|nr:aspartic peptidase domain-containing protein [Suillus spraguei]
MFSVLSLLALLVSSITGLPVEVHNSLITLPMTRRLTFSNVTDILRDDEARMAAFREYSTIGPRAGVDVPLSNIGTGYTVAVNVGNPPITYNLIVDSSSSITWVGARNPYVSSTGVNTGEPVEVNYLQGINTGELVEVNYLRDSLTFTNGLSITEMPIAVASTPLGFDGLLGIGPQMSSLGALQNQNLREDTIPSVTDYLYMNNAIRQGVVSIFFQPVVRGVVNHGQLTFGGTDPAYSDKLKYTPVTPIPPLSRYWGINQRIIYGNTEIMPYTTGIVDCSCIFLYIAPDAYERYKDATGGIVNPANGLLQISTTKYNALRVLKFHIGLEVYKLNSNAQIWPRSLNYMVNGYDDDIFLVVRSLDTGVRHAFIIGYVFLQRFYTVFDSDRSRVGFARTEFTAAITNF